MWCCGANAFDANTANCPARSGTGISAAQRTTHPAMDGTAHVAWSRAFEHSAPFNAWQSKPLVTPEWAIPSPPHYYTIHVGLPCTDDMLDN
jgi:hypothetical protein